MIREAEKTGEGVIGTVGPLRKIPDLSDPVLKLMQGKPYGIANCTHYCGFFLSVEQAEAQIAFCRDRRNNKYVASLYGEPTEPCRVCDAAQLIQDRPFRWTYSYYPLSNVADDIIVVQYLNKASTAQNLD